jgi:hypothetical protein
MLHRRAIVPARLDGVGACPTRINSPVFLLTSLTYNRDRDNKNAVVFPGIGADRFFDLFLANSQLRCNGCVK